MSLIASEIFRMKCSFTKPKAEALARSLKRMRRFAIATTSCLLLFTASCAITPQTKQSLDSYIQAMDEVHESANLLLSDFASNLEAGKQSESGGAQGSDTKPEYPPEFLLPHNQSQATSKVDKAIAESRVALEVIRQYNDALVALAEGRPEAEIKNQINQFGGALQTLTSLGGLAVPGFGEFSDIAAKVIKLAQDAHNLEQFKQAVKEGRQPVELILIALENQTPAMYEASVVITKQRQSAVKKNIRQVGSALKLFLEKYSPPPAESDLNSEMAKFQAELVAIGNRTKTLAALPNQFPFRSGKEVYDEVAHKDMKIFMQAVRASNAQYEEIVARQNAYYKIMDKYVALLGQTRQSMEALSDSLEAPIDINREAFRLIQVAFELRDAMAVIRTPSVAPSSI